MHSFIIFFVQIALCLFKSYNKWALQKNTKDTNKCEKCNNLQKLQIKSFSKIFCLQMAWLTVESKWNFKHQRNCTKLNTLNISSHIVNSCSINKCSNVVHYFSSVTVFKILGNRVQTKCNTKMNKNGWEQTKCTQSKKWILKSNLN